MKVTVSLAVNASQQAVWNIITDIRHAADYMGGIEKTEIVHQPAAGINGLRWQETRIYFGKPATVEKWITEAVGNKYYKTRAEADGFLFETTMTIEEAGEGVNLISTHETKAQGFVARLKSLPMIFFKGMLKKAILKDLQDIKAAAEKKV